MQWESSVIASVRTATTAWVLGHDVGHEDSQHEHERGTDVVHSEKPQLSPKVTELRVQISGVGERQHDTDLL